MVSGERRKVRPIKLVFPYGLGLQNRDIIIFLQKRRLFNRLRIQQSLTSTPIEHIESKVTKRSPVMEIPIIYKAENPEFHLHIDLNETLHIFPERSLQNG